MASSTETHGVTQASDFLARLYDLADQRAEEAGMMLIYEFFYELQIKQAFTRCDDVLAALDVSRLSPVLLTAILTITAASKEELNQREPFYQASTKAISALRGPERTARILIGLE